MALDHRTGQGRCLLAVIQSYQYLYQPVSVLVVRISRFFGFDLTYQSAEENLANLHYRIGSSMVPQFMLRVSKRSEISCHLANNRENFMHQVFLYRHSDHGKSWLH